MTEDTSKVEGRAVIAVDAPRTVVALLSPFGRAALASLEIHGCQAISIARQLFHPAASIPGFGHERMHYYGRFGREVVDDVVLAVLNPLAHNTPAGIQEGLRGQTVQVHCHGGTTMVRALLAEIESLGTKVVDWREMLSEQGVHWTRIEAASALGQAKAWRAAAILLDQWQGRLERAFQKISAQWPVPGDRQSNEQGSLRTSVESLLEWSELGRHLLEPWRVMLLGRPNVGKSTLLNALLGYDRVIVHESPGTTRDVIEIETALDGWPVRLCDGAGLRESEDAVEQAGVEMAKQWSRSADLRILVRDLSRKFEEDDDVIEVLDPHLIVGNKMDLPSPWNDRQVATLDAEVSAASSEGLDRLVGLIVERLVPRTPPVGQAIPFSSPQVDWLRRRLGDDKNSAGR